MKNTKTNTNETETISAQLLKKGNYEEIMNIITSNKTTAEEIPTAT